jgi:hypothetical protein
MIEPYQLDKELSFQTFKIKIVQLPKKGSFWLNFLYVYAVRPLTFNNSQCFKMGWEPMQDPVQSFFIFF